MSAFFAGVAGAVYAQQMQVLGAKTFNFMRSIDILVIVVLGGLGSLTGSILSAIGLTAARLLRIPDAHLFGRADRGHDLQAIRFAGNL